MKFFVLGLGSIGMRHAKNLLALGHEVYGYDVSLSVAMQAKEFGVLVSGHGLDADAYVICTPPEAHLYDMIEAVDRDKHVFVEKPIAVLEDIRPLSKLLKDAKRKNLVVMVGNNLRFNQPIKELKAYLSGGSFGNLLWADICVGQRNTKYKEPVLLNWGAHEIDLALHLLGPAKVKTCVGNDQIADIFLQHENGCRSHVHVDYLTEPEYRRGIIIGTDNNIEYQIRVPDQDYVDEMQEFIMRINRVKDHQGWVGAIGDDGLAALKIIAEAMRMADAGN